MSTSATFNDFDFGTGEGNKKPITESKYPFKPVNHYVVNIGELMRT